MSKPHQLSHQLAVLTFQGKDMNEMLQKTPIQSPFKPKCGKKNAATALPPLSYCLSLLYQRYRFVCLSYSLFLRFSPSFAVAASESRQSAKISKRGGWGVNPQGESWIKRTRELRGGN